MFRFRLQRVLEMRELKERDAATALATAQDALEQARAEEQRLVEARDALATRTASSIDGAPAPTGASIGALRTLHFLLGRLDERVANAATATDSAAHEAARRQDDLTAAFRDRRTIDRLRERHQESWRAAELAADRQLMDEIALSRYAQPGAAPGPNDTSHES